MKWTLADVWGILGFILMMAGLTGLSWEMFREGGWGGKMLGATWGAAVSKPVILVPMLIVAGVVAALLKRGSTGKGVGKHFSDTLVYLLMALGVYFIYHWLT